MAIASKLNQVGSSLVIIPAPWQGEVGQGRRWGGEGMADMKIKVPSAENSHFNSICLEEI